MPANHTTRCQECSAPDIMNRRVLIASGTVHTRGRISAHFKGGQVHGSFGGVSQVELASRCNTLREADVREAAQSIVGNALRAAGRPGPTSIRFEGIDIEFIVGGPRYNRVHSNGAKVLEQIGEGQLSLFSWTALLAGISFITGGKLALVRDRLDFVWASLRDPKVLYDSASVEHAARQELERRVAEIDKHVLVCVRCGAGMWV